MKKITIGVSGGIAAYKVASLISYLKKFDIDIRVIMTKNATNFITPLTLETLSKNKVLIDEFEENMDNGIPHIEYSQNTDLFIIVPATANIIGKIANGIADDLLTSSVIACNKQVLIIPAMNTYMYENQILKDNLKKLKKYHYHILEPQVKTLACGLKGMGALPDIKDIADKINKLINYKEERE